MSKLIVKGNKPSDFRWKDREAVTNKEFMCMGKSVATIYIVEYEIDVDKMREIYSYKDDYKDLPYEDRFCRFAYFFENDARSRAIDLLEMFADRIKGGITITECPVYVHQDLGEYPRKGFNRDKYLTLLEGGTCYHKEDRYKEHRSHYDHLEPNNK
tara:strand:+ start:837 stop:1304 length:468 start_codon:yes stop_codon:yes gene_type:complete